MDYSIASQRDRHPQQLLVEEGAAFAELSGPRGERPLAPRGEEVDVAVIGGGQAGLSVGYYLARAGARFVILDASRRIGDAWRARWESLRLFTPAKFDALPGLRFPGDPDAFPTKDEMADYLEAYAHHFRLPVRSGVRVERLSREGSSYLIETDAGRYRARQVVVAMANYQRPRVPELAGRLDPEIVQLHSSEYRSPSQLREGPVLIVGAGNSGSEIAVELSTRHAIFMSGRDTGHMPFRVAGVLGRWILVRLVLRVLFHRLLTVDNPIGRRARRAILGKGGPLIRVKPRDLIAAGVERVPATVDVRDGRPVVEGGRPLDVANVVWCTGFEPGFDWIDLPIFGDDGAPVHESGVVTGEPGLCFVGLHFLHALSSVMIHGVGRDARRIARHLGSKRSPLSPPVSNLTPIVSETNPHRKRRGDMGAELP